MLESVAAGSHILGIYHDVEHELNDCFAFLKAGIENNEAVLVIVDDKEGSLGAAIIERVQKEWSVTNLQELEANGDIKIIASKEWYYPDEKFEIDRCKTKWQKVVDDALANGKRGLRVFADVSDIIKAGFSKELVDYEYILGSSFKIPFTAICAYRVSDIVNIMTPEQMDMLHLSHGVHRSINYNVLENPSTNQHIALIYESDEQRDAAIAD
jgi:hypothetical protein